MSLRPQPQPTLSDKFRAISKLSSAALSATSAVLNYEARIEKNITFAAYVKKAYTRSLFYSCTPLQLQWLLDSSSKAYKTWIKKHHKDQDMKLKTDVLEDGAKLHWIGPQDAEKVILYFHGGGFVIPLNKDHLGFMNTLRLRLKQEANVNVKVAFLEYGDDVQPFSESNPYAVFPIVLIPTGRYPIQLKQATRALRYLLNLNIPPSNILIAGDSAGGLIIFQLLSHLLHPHPSIDPVAAPANRPGPFAGVLVISPWISFVNYSYRDNGVDFIPARVIETWASLMAQENDGSRDPKSEKRRSDRPLLLDIETTIEGHWLQPSQAPAEWWQDTYKYASHILLTHGTKEVMSEDIVQFGEELDRALRWTKAGVKVIPEVDGVHSGPLLAQLLGRKEDEFMHSLLDWMVDRFIKD